LLSYELWNEVAIFHNANPIIWQNNNAQAVTDWHIKMVNYIKALDKKHMITSSSGGPGFFNFGNIALDYLQDHYYSNDMNVLYNYAVFAQYSIKNYKKPYITGEIGAQACWLGSENFTHNNFPAGNYAHDIMEFHDAIWASLFNGSAGPAFSWDSGTLFNKCWGGAYKNFKPMSMFLNKDDFFSQELTYLMSNPTGNKGPKDDQTHNYNNNHFPLWCYYSINNAPPNPLEGYLTYDISTTNDESIDVFAAKSEDRIYGWVHNRTNYWYNLPHSSGNPNVYPCSTFNDNQPSSPSNVQSQIKQTFTISNIACDGIYKVDFYSTYPQYDIDNDNILDDGGIIMPLSIMLHVHCGSLTVPIPTLSPLSYTGGSLYAPDYAFKITKMHDDWSHTLVTGGLNQLSKLTSYNSEKVYYSDENGAIRSVALNTNFNAFQYNVISPFLPNQAEKAFGAICVNEGSQVFYKGYDGRLQCYFPNGTGYSHIWLTNFSDNSQNVGNYITYSPFNVFYQGADYDLHRYHFNTTTNSWQHSILSNNYGINGKVFGAIAVDQNDNTIYYRGGDDRLQCYYLNNGNYDHIWLTDWSNNSQNVAGDIKWNGTDVYYAGTDGYLHNYHYDVILGNWVHSHIVNGNNQYVAIPSNTEMTLVDNANQIFFKGLNGQMQHLYGKQGVQYFQDDVICSDDLQNMYKGNGTIMSDNQESIYYVGLDNALHIYAFDNGCTPRIKSRLKESSSANLNMFADDKNGIYTQSSIINKIAFNEDSLSVYPSPFSNDLKIEPKDGDELKIINVMGQVVYQSHLNSFEKKMRINTSNFPKGVYFVVVYKGSQIRYKTKVVKNELNNLFL